MLGDFLQGEQSGRLKRARGAWRGRGVVIGGGVAAGGRGHRRDVASAEGSRPDVSSADLCFLPLQLWVNPPICISLSFLV